MRSPKSVLLDSNFLIACEKLRINIPEEVAGLAPNARLATVKPVVNELERLRKRAALALAAHLRLKILDARGPADRALLDAAVKNGAAVCTNDRALKKQCAAKNVAVIFVREKKKLEIR